jgi:hypothetical protein
MGLNFTGEAGVYLPARDVVKITAVDGERLVNCYVMRSALNAIGCDEDDDDAPTLLRHFQRERDAVEIAAMVKYRRALLPMSEIEIEASDLATVFPAAAA